MGKSVVSLNKNVKRSSKNKFNYKKILITLQFILTISLIILALVVLFQASFLYIFEIFLGITLLIMGLNNYLIYKREKLTLIYSVIGICIIIFAILKMLGV